MLTSKSQKNIMLWIGIGLSLPVISFLFWHYFIKPQTLKNIAHQRQLVANKVAYDFSVQSNLALDRVHELFQSIQAHEPEKQMELIGMLDDAFRAYAFLVAFSLPAKGYTGGLELFNPYVQVQSQSLSKSKCDTALKQNINSRKTYQSMITVQFQKYICVYDASMDMNAIINLGDALNDAIQLENTKGFFVLMTEQSLTKFSRHNVDKLVMDEVPFNALDQSWHFYIAPSAIYIKERLMRAFFVFFTVLIGLLGLLIWWYIKYNTHFLSNQKYVLKLKRLALYDGVTNLPNRRYCWEQFRMILKHAKRGKTSFALCFIDCNDFKNINDKYGHDAGDIVLRHIADQVTQSIRPNDFFARYAGDEFCLILDDGANTEGIKAAIQKIMSAIAAPVFIGETTIEVTVSVGISIYPYSGSSAEALLKRADKAMYQAKGTHQNNFKIDGH